MVEVNIGKRIREKLDEQGRGVGWFADRLGCCRDNIYKIFQRKYIDTGLLLKISKVLDYDFFAEYSEYIKSNK
ncbi:MAG: XRE family transcriptional regulator [Bacteroidales bacterium]|nr:XRE family transcriptional regulator [Bacteroidales bacterium]